MRRSVPFDRLAAFDRRFFSEARDSFLAAWITLPERAALVALRDGKLAGFAVMRACRTTSRVGPLFAESPDIAAALVSALAAKIGRQGGGDRRAGHQQARRRAGRGRPA